MSMLFTLPLEIRNRIYKLLLSHHSSPGASVHTADAVMLRYTPDPETEDFMPRVLSPACRRSSYASRSPQKTQKSCLACIGSLAYCETPFGFTLPPWWGQRIWAQSDDFILPFPSERRPHLMFRSATSYCST